MNDFLPDDHQNACLAGRIMHEGDPYTVTLRGYDLIDLSDLAPTMSELCDLADPAGSVRAHVGRKLCHITDISRPGNGSGGPTLLAPCDLQAIKAAGVTFVSSMVERVIEERAKGNSADAARLRQEIMALTKVDLAAIRPGSAEAKAAKDVLVEAGLWSQYLEVGIGPYAEIFTKSQPMSAVGHEALIGIHPESHWNNPEPEIVLACASDGRAVGATLGNDVNLRDFEGMSALLLGKAKDNNASCAIGPFIRLFDTDFTIDDVRKAEVTLTVEGAEGFKLVGTSSMTKISRDPLELVSQTSGATHQYPDGFMLFCGTMFAPTEDRDGNGKGFTHHENDAVTVASPRLGQLRNRVTTSDKAPPWTFGTRALVASLARRNLAR